MGNLFNIHTGGDLIISRIEKGDIPIISHSISNNGVAGYTATLNGKKLFNRTTTISLADRGNFYAFVQKMDFYIGTRVKALEAKFPNCNSYILQFICPMINKQSAKFSYGNNATSGVEQITIMLPITNREIPDYEYMEQYMRKKEQESLLRYLEYIEKREV
jgi:hypothetical protein